MSFVDCLLPCTFHLSSKPLKVKNTKTKHKFNTEYFQNGNQSTIIMTQGNRFTESMWFYGLWAVVCHCILLFI